MSDPESPAAREEDAAAIEAERRRLAARLQHSVVEPLNLLLAQANTYEQTLAANPTARLAVSVLASLARQALQQVRDLESDLNPAVLEALGLSPALETLAGQITRAHGLRLSLAFDRLPERLPPALELALYRAAQDALNRARLCRASHVTLRLRRAEGLTLSISDNSLDPDIESLHPSLVRLEQLGATIKTERTGGLELTISLPLAPPVALTPREMEILKLLATGMSNKEIARALSVSPRTVNFHLDNLYAKLGVGSRTEAVLFALRQGWIQPGSRQG